MTNLSLFNSVYRPFLLMAQPIDRIYILLNDGNFCDWLRTIPLYTTAEKTRLLQLYHEWQQLLTTYKQLEFEWLRQKINHEPRKNGT